jgi:hypothetical protein
MALATFLTYRELLALTRQNGTGATPAAEASERRCQAPVRTPSR